MGQVVTGNAVRREIASFSPSRASIVGLAADVSPAPIVASHLKVLVIGSGSNSKGARPPGVEGLVAAATRLGLWPAIVTAGESTDVLAHCGQEVPDITVLALHADILVRHTCLRSSTPWEEWSRITRELVRLDVPVLAVGVGTSVAAIAACVREGAIGVLDIDEFAQQLEECVVSVRGKRLRQHKTGRAHALRSGRLPRPYEALSELTPSEGRILYHMMRGLSAHEIADHLVVSLATVRSHIRAILHKLGVSSQLAAVALANGAQPDVIDAG